MSQEHLVLKLNNVMKSYGDKVVLDDISFSLQRGERVALLGANGSGKTTIIRTIGRLLTCDKGLVSFADSCIQNSTRYLQNLGIVLEGSRNTNWRLNPKQNARYFSGLKGLKWQKCQPAYANLIKQLGLHEYEHMPVGKLSTGNKQKVALLCALVHQPELLIMDEPTLGLDWQTVHELETMLLAQSVKQDQGFLITSHDFRFIENVCTRVLLIQDGKLAFDGSMETFKQQLHRYELRIELPQHHQHCLLSDSMLQQDSGLDLQANEQELVIRYDQPKQILSLLSQLDAQNHSIKQLSIMPISAEQAYQNFTRKIA